MTQYVLVNNIEHHDLRIDTTHSAELGDNVFFAQTFCTELNRIQRHYPVFFHKDPQTGEFNTIALFGLEQGENLFLHNHHWQADYIPLSMQRLPFAIGFQQTSQGDLQRVVTLDIDSPRVSSSTGQPLFLEFGGNSDYLEYITATLETLHTGAEEDKAFIRTLQTYDLIESVTLDIELSNQQTIQLNGFYTVDLTRLAHLENEAILNLVHQGYLEAIYMLNASHTNMQSLIARKENQISTQHD